MTESIDVGNEIIGGCKDVFSTMLMVELEAENVVEGKADIKSNITSMIGLGGGLKGLLAVHCPSSVAKNITSGFLGMDVEEIDDDVKNYISEFIRPDQKYLTRMFTEEAVNFIKQNKSEPFFLYLPHSMPHRPLHVSESFEGKSELGLYGDVIMELDWSAGEIIKALKDQGIYKNTIFIFTSDNGPDVGSAVPLRGRKASTWEGGQRVPGIIVWPDKIPGGIVCSDLASTLDLLPTLASITGSEIPEGLLLDGTDISETLFYPDSIRIADHPFFYYGRDGDLEAVRFDNWKLHISKRGVKDFIPALYNLDDDISEQNNQADKYPDIVNYLHSMIIEFK